MENTLTDNQFDSIMLYLEAVQYYDAACELVKANRPYVFVLNTLLSFSIELFMKSILKYESINYYKDHSLYRLFKILPKKYELLITKNISFPLIINKTNEKNVYKDIYCLLQVIDKDFIDNRYVFNTYSKQPVKVSHYLELEKVAKTFQKIGQDIINELTLNMC